MNLYFLINFTGATLNQKCSSKGNYELKFKILQINQKLKILKLKAYLAKRNDTWQQMQTNAMHRDFSWRSSAEQYLALYDSI